MSDLRELYQEVIIDHNRSPRNYHEMTCATHHAEGYNPLCGDQLTLYLQIENDIIKQVSFIGRGCAISTASASLLTETLTGKSISVAEELFQKFHDAVMQGPDTSIAQVDLPAKLQVLLGVRDYPARVKCATLSWHAMKAALGQQTHVSTE